MSEHQRTAHPHYVGGGAMSEQTIGEREDEAAFRKMERAFFALPRGGPSYSSWPSIADALRR